MGGTDSRWGLRAAEAVCRSFQRSKEHQLGSGMTGICQEIDEDTRRADSETTAEKHWIVESSGPQSSVVLEPMTASRLCGGPWIQAACCYCDGLLAGEVSSLLVQTATDNEVVT